MAQEQFAGPEHYTEFDPEKFLRDMNLIKDMGAKDGSGGNGGNSENGTEGAGNDAAAGEQNS